MFDMLDGFLDGVLLFVSFLDMMSGMFGLLGIFDELLLKLVGFLSQLLVSRVSGSLFNGLSSFGLGVLGFFSLVGSLLLEVLDSLGVLLHLPFEALQDFLLVSLSSFFVGFGDPSVNSGGNVSSYFLSLFGSASVVGSLSSVMLDAMLHGKSVVGSSYHSVHIGKSVVLSGLSHLAPSIEHALTGNGCNLLGSLPKDAVGFHEHSSYSMLFFGIEAGSSSSKMLAVRMVS